MNLFQEFVPWLSIPIEQPYKLIPNTRWSKQYDSLSCPHMVWCEHEMSFLAHVLDLRPLDVGIIWGGSRNARRWNLAENVCHWERVFRSNIPVALSVTLHLLCVLSQWGEEGLLHMLPITMMFCTSAWGQAPMCQALWNCECKSTFFPLNYSFR